MLASNALHQAWLATGDVPAAWIALAEAAHGVNQAIVDGLLARPACRRSESDQSCDLNHITPQASSIPAASTDVASSTRRCGTQACEQRLSEVITPLNVV